MQRHIYFSTWLLFVVAASIVGAQETDSESNTEIAPESATELSAPTSDLNEAKCSKARSGCCSELYLGDEDTILKCFTLHQSKMPDPDDQDMGKLVKFLSCFVECIYKQKKYITKSDMINMKMVKLDAEKSYEGRPKEKKYHVEMYDFCRKDAVGLFNLLKATPGGKILIKDACRPYLMLVFLCTAEYHKKHACPYFRWEAGTKSGNEEKCRSDRAKCYEIDGIEVPE